MFHFYYYSWLSLSRTLKGPENLFEIGRVRDRERKIGYSLHKGTETLVRDRESFEIERVRDRESQLYYYDDLFLFIDGMFCTSVLTYNFLMIQF